MLTAFFIAIHLQTAPLSLPAGFYTLKELGASMQKQGIGVDVANDVSDDLYAIRINHLSWPEFRASLTQDERLEVEPKGDRWMVRRNRTNRQREQKQFEAYIGSFATSIRKTYSQAAEACIDFEKRPPAEQKRIEAELATPNHRSNLSKEADNLVYLYESAHDFPWFNIGVPWQLSLRNEPVLGRPTVVNLIDARYAASPSGDLLPLYAWRNPGKQASEEALLGWAKSIRATAKFIVEPVTLAGTYILVMDLPEDGKYFSLNIGREPVVPTRVRVEVKPTTVWKADELKAIDSRAQGTVPGADIETAFPARPIPASEAMLRWAKATDQNIVAYVSTITEPSVAASAKKSLQDMAKDINAGKVDATHANLAMVERTGSLNLLGVQPALATVPRITLSKVGSVLVVRNEWRFIDQSGGGSGVLTSRDFNTFLDDKKPTIDRVTELVAKLDLSRWKNSIFASRDLSVCNPISLRPFAMAYRTSSAFREAISKAALRKPLDLPVTAIGEGAAIELERGLIESAPLNDAKGSCEEDPISAPLAWSQAPLNDRRIRVFRLADGLSVQFIVRGITIWETWLGNVEMTHTSRTSGSRK